MVREDVKQTTVALALLLVVLFIATFFGSRAALVASVLGMLSFNYFFLPPYGTLAIAERQFTVTIERDDPERDEATDDGVKDEMETTVVCRRRG